MLYFVSITGHTQVINTGSYLHIDPAPLFYLRFSSRQREARFTLMKLLMPPAASAVNFLEPGVWSPSWPSELRKSLAQRLLRSPRPRSSRPSR